MYKNKIFTGVLAISTIISNLAFADGTHTDAKGNGNAKTTLETGVKIEETQSADFGTITRFGKNPRGWVHMDTNGNITSTSDKIKTEGTGTALTFKVSIPPNTVLSDIGESDGYMTNADGSKKIYVANDGISDFFSGAFDRQTNTYVGAQSGTYGVIIDIELKGDEPDGEYSTTNPGGIPLEIEFDY